MKTVVYNENKEKVKEIELDNEVFGVKPNYDLIHQVVRSLSLRRRKPIAHTKGRGEVSGGGRKPWRQKGTGRARHGSIRSPLWRKGGVTHGPTNNRSFDLKINKKMKDKALKMILSIKAQEGLLQVICPSEALCFEKTKKAKEFFQKFLKANKRLQRGLLVYQFAKKQEAYGIRNLSFLKWIPPQSINILDLVNYKYLICTEDSINSLTMFLKK